MGSSSSKQDEEDGGGDQGACSKACGAVAGGCANCTQCINETLGGWVVCKTCFGNSCKPRGYFALSCDDAHGVVRSGYFLVPILAACGVGLAYLMLVVGGLSAGLCFFLMTFTGTFCVCTGPRAVDPKISIRKLSFRFLTGVMIVLLGFSFGCWMFLEFGTEVTEFLKGVIIATSVIGVLGVTLACALTGCCGDVFEGCRGRLFCLGACGGSSKAKVAHAPDGNTDSDAVKFDDAQTGFGSVDVRSALLPPLNLQIRTP